MYQWYIVFYVYTFMMYIVCISRIYVHVRKGYFLSHNIHLDVCYHKTQLKYHNRCRNLYIYVCIIEICFGNRSTNYIQCQSEMEFKQEDVEDFRIVKVLIREEYIAKTMALEFLI